MRTTHIEGTKYYNTKDIYKKLEIGGSIKSHQALRNSALRCNAKLLDNADTAWRSSEKGISHEDLMYTLQSLATKKKNGQRLHIISVMEELGMTVKNAAAVAITTENNTHPKQQSRRNHERINLSELKKELSEAKSSKELLIKDIELLNSKLDAANNSLNEKNQLEIELKKSNDLIGDLNELINESSKKINQQNKSLIQFEKTKTRLNNSEKKLSESIKLVDELNKDISSLSKSLAEKTKYESAKATILRTIPSLSSFINILDIGLINIGLFRLFEVPGIVLGVMASLYLFDAQRNAKKAELNNSNRNTLETVFHLCAASFLLHVITFYNAAEQINLVTSTHGQVSIYWVRLFAAVVSGLFVSVLSYKAVEMTVQVAKDESKNK